MDKYTAAANIALFLTERKGSCLSRWEGRLSAAEQRALLGCVVGKGLIIIDGANETVSHIVKVSFGGDYDETLYSLNTMHQVIAAKAAEAARLKALRMARQQQTA